MAAMNIGRFLPNNHYNLFNGSEIPDYPINIKCRFTFKEAYVSKVATQFYKNTQWYSDLEQTKKVAKTKRAQTSASLYPSQPPKPTFNLKTKSHQMYIETANEMTNKTLFSSPKLTGAIETSKDHMGEKA
jgi:hypothetical protein